MQNIPGMIEPSEQNALSSYLQRMKLHPGEAIVEFGSYFGKSTHAMCKGLQANTACCDNKVYAYDRFSCKLSDDFFVSYVKNQATSAGVSHLLRVCEGNLSFVDIFKYYLDPYLQEGCLEFIEASLEESFPRCVGKIGFMHIDSPKAYSEMKYILYRFFPLLREDSLVFFQDYFCPLSASLIACIEYLTRAGFLSPEATSASTLICKVSRQFTIEALMECDIEMQRPQQVTNYINHSIEHFSNLTIDRKTVFYPRLEVALMQWEYENGNYKESATVLKKLFKDVFNGKIAPAVLDDISMLHANGYVYKY